jgi:hypothetical protein
MLECVCCGKTIPDPEFFFECCWCEFKGCEACGDRHDCPGWPPGKVARLIAAIRDQACSGAGERACAYLLRALEVAADEIAEHMPDLPAEEALDEISRVLEAALADARPEASRSVSSGVRKGARGKSSHEPKIGP